MNKVLKLVPITIFAALLLAACGENDEVKVDEQGEIVFTEERDMEADDVKRTQAAARLGFQIVSALILDVDGNPAKGLPFSDEVGNVKDVKTKDDVIKEVISNSILNDSSVEVYQQVLQEANKNAKRFSPNDWKLSKAAIREDILKIKKYQDMYIAETVLEAEYTGLKNNKKEVVNYEIRFVGAKDEYGRIKATYIEFEEGSSESGNGKLSKEGMIKEAKNMIQFGFENATGLNYEDNERTVQAFSSYTRETKVVEEFINKVPLDRTINKLKFNYKDIAVSSQEDSTGTKGYTQKFTVTTELELSSIRGEEKVKETYQIEIVIQNVAGEGFTSYQYEIVDLKIKK